jgi:hypothetical protein
MWTRLHLCANPRASAWLLVHPTTPTFCLSPTHFLISLHTHIGLPHPMMAHLSQCHYGHTIDDLGTHLLWCSYGSEHTTTHNKFSGCYCNNCFGKWSTCSKGGLPPFPSPHPMMNRYPYHQRQLLDLHGHHHCWFNSHIYGAMSTDNNHTCNDDGYLGEDTIIHWASTKQWFHSHRYWNVWGSSFLF